MTSESPAAIAEQLGERLRQARLNANLTQNELAEQCGLSRKLIMGAEKGKAQLESLVAILQALNLTEQLDLFIPAQTISPVQLARLQGKKRQRASGNRSSQTPGENTEW